MNFKKLTILFFILNCTSLISQNIDFENLGKFKKARPIKITGNVAANTVFYNSNNNQSRSPFTYFLRGGLNVSIYGFTIPLSYTFSNLGGDLEYQLPFNFNRLSLHPKYKWIQAHIGDVSMSFSPYTLSGHQFTGAGFDLTPKGAFSVSLMGGRLLKAIPIDADKKNMPSFRRLGGGAKFGFKKGNYNFSLIGFYAKDDINSLQTFSDQDLTPKENLVLSGGFSIKLLKYFTFEAEYASSAITKDIRAKRSECNSGIACLFLNSKLSTESYKAYKAGFIYGYKKYKFGVNYERIDPGYETLGSYFFNNDFENITLNGTTFLFNKLNLAFNLGYQKDNLENQKDKQTDRVVGSLNASYRLNKKINLSGSYSNFSTYTNNRLNQFTTINDDNLLDNEAEQFNYRQLSQNANLNVSYSIKQSNTSKQNLNVNYSLAVVENQENGIVRIGNGSTFHNINTSYSLGLPTYKMNITSAFNSTFNTIGRDDSKTFGPTLAVSKKILNDKMNLNFSTSYNYTDGIQSNSSALNFRVGANYRLFKKHMFNLNAIQLFRNSNVSNSKDLTVTFGYNYAFDLLGANKKEKN